MRNPDPIPWSQLPGLSAALGDDCALLGASQSFVELLRAQGAPAHWIDCLAAVSRAQLSSCVQRKTDFHCLIEFSAPSSCWLACNAHWVPAHGHHVCHFADTTPIEEARLQAQKQVERVHLIFKMLPVMVAHFGPRPHNRCEFANQQFAALFGHDAQSILGIPALDLIGRNLREAVVPFLRRTLREHKPVTFPFEFIAANGVPMRLEVTVTFAGDAHDTGADKGFFYLISDITERHKTEFALRESEDRLSRFMNASEECVVFHRDGLITDANPATSQLLDTPLHQLLGRSVLELVAPEYRARAITVIASGADAAYESEVFNARGERIPVEIIGRSMMRNGERLRMAVVRDIRDRREAQARIHELIEGLRSEKDKAEAADRAKSVFLAAASHDLRQPIHALSLFLTALRSMSQSRSVRTADLAEICRRMQASLDGLGQLLNMLLDVSRLDANAVQVERSPTSAQRLLEELDQDFHQLATEKGLRLHVASSRLWVDTDPTVLRRILVNLVSNAVRYTSRGRVLIGCRLRGPEVEFQVWDSGIGIPPEQREAIFEEFFQIGQTQAAGHESHGLGLGLSIVKRSALLLGAPLDLRSTPGRGSMFSIRVPRCEAPTHTAPALHEPAYPQSVTRMGVLVIDDDEQVLAAMRSVLGVWGHHVFCATSPDEAVVMAISHASDIDLLISDYRLGGNVTAIDAIRAVHACLPRTVPTYILTGDTSPQRIHEASELGFPLLHKPIDAHTLRAILDP
ncbi:ATP-binding protein [Hydrogenophaga sp.]|uniref:PAS domain-containing hybrid sensor histidine kinase/response regulator n=2 Tax=Hydrogenophaga sp. TaxID=1904254 RepID=UPI0027319895|nr:ATP-binding protein [Hydrogenophaga sp.]MDP2073212.1 PAS domain S-box protein [Hydrogenophaga sp.]MDP3110078.1 PAS domain S-box protein [Hydrogenophaga sp.]